MKKQLLELKTMQGVYAQIYKARKQASFGLYKKLNFKLLLP